MEIDARVKSILKKAGWTSNRRVKLEEKYPKFFKNVLGDKKNRSLAKDFWKIRPFLEQFCGLSFDIGRWSSMTVFLPSRYSFYREEANMVALKEFLQEDIFHVGMVGEEPIFMNLYGEIYHLIPADRCLYITENFFDTIEHILSNNLEECPAIDLTKFVLPVGPNYLA